MLVSVMGDATSHGGVVTATGSKLKVSGIVVTVHGDAAPDSNDGGGTVVAGVHKLNVSGIPVAALMDLITCSATISSPGGAKLVVT